jgi:protein-tyrosine phosphatase
MTSFRPEETILFVCTGNIARSPFMEYTLRERLAQTPASGFRIASAGTFAVANGRVHPAVNTELKHRGVDADAFTSTQLTARHALDAGLILTASRDHRRQVARIAPERRNVTFTLRQFVRLVQLDPVGEVRRAASSGLLPALAQLASRNRGLSSGTEDTDDIADPAGGNRRSFAAAFDAIDPAIDILANLITGGLRRSDA